MFGLHEDISFPPGFRCCVSARLISMGYRQSGRSFRNWYRARYLNDATGQVNSNDANRRVTYSARSCVCGFGGEVEIVQPVEIDGSRGLRQDHPAALHQVDMVGHAKRPVGVL